MKCYGILLAIFIVVSTTICASYAQNADETKRNLAAMTFQMGVKKIITQRPDEAAKLFDYSIQLTDSTHSPSLYYKAITTADANPENALYLVNKATSIWSDNTSFLEVKAQLQNKLFKYKEALETNLLLYELTPNSPYYTYYCAVLFAINGDFIEANRFAKEYEDKFGFHEKIYDIRYDYFLRSNRMDSLQGYVIEKMESQPNNPTVLVHFGQIMSSQNNDSLAINAYTKALDIDPNNPKFYMSLIDFNLSRKNYEDLVANANDLFNLDGIRVDFKINLVNQLIHYIEPHGKFKEQLIELTRLIVEKEPDNTKAIQFYVGLLSFVNQNDKAYNFLKDKYAKGELKEDMIHTFLMYIYNSTDKDKSIEVTSQFLKIYPQNMEINNFMMAMLSINKEYKKLSKLVDEVILFTQNDSTKSMLYVTKASATEHIATVKKTIKDFDSALKFDPNNAMALNNYAYFLAQKSIKLEYALTMATKALAINPNDINYIDTKAWVYFKMGKYNEANSLMIKMLSIENKISDEVILHLGDILFAKGSELMARDKWLSVKDKSYKDNVSERLLLKADDIEGLLKIINKYE